MSHKELRDVLLLSGAIQRYRALLAEKSLDQLVHHFSFKLEHAFDTVSLARQTTSPTVSKDLSGHTFIEIRNTEPFLQDDSIPV